jgi:hypothetical protein
MTAGDTRTWLTLGAVLVSAIIVGSIVSSNMKLANPFTDSSILLRGLGLPTIWLFYNTGDVNAREWADFGARSSRVLNVPYLNLAYEAILRNNAGKYRVEVINGVNGVAELLGWDAIPEPMRTAEREMNGREIDWIRAAILARYGGLWLEPSAITLRGFGSLPSDKIVFFGTDLDENIVGEGGSRVPGMRAVWAPKSGLPVFTKWAAAAHERVTKSMGGHIESGEKWHYIRFAEKNPDVIVNVAGECGRTEGVRIQLDDILGIAEDGRVPFVTDSNSIFVPMPWKELTLRRSLEWFLRMSEEQIMESELVVKWLLDATAE